MNYILLKKTAPGEGFGYPTKDKSLLRLQYNVVNLHTERRETLVSSSLMSGEDEYVFPEESAE